MSTDHQQYSTANQSQAIREYPARHGFKIERTYEDSGKSGLNLDDRDALKQLIEDVQSGRAEFSTIVVYDVSRWGRFQDADESAYYEYICKRAGISVRYCAEQFENDGSPVSTIVKGVKRAMARSLSTPKLCQRYHGPSLLLPRLTPRCRDLGVYGRHNANECGEKRRSISGILANPDAVQGRFAAPQATHVRNPSGINTHSCMSAATSFCRHA